MNFTTPVELPANLPRLRHADRLLLLGSCFATNMGTRLADAKFSCDINPYGVLYNPLSISAALREIILGKVYGCLLYTSPSPRDVEESRMPSSA